MSEFLTNQEIRKELRRIVQEVKNFDAVVYPQFLAMYWLGIRAQESIKREMWQFQGSDVLVLSPQKYNDKRVFAVQDVPEEFLFYLKNADLFKYNVNYSRLNYTFSQLINYSAIFVGKKASTLHLFRHNFVKKLLEIGKTPEEIKIILGERQMKSTLAYVDSKFSLYPQK